jgi:hypothetical protein
LGECALEENVKVGIYEFKHESSSDPRITLSRESFKILGDEGCQIALAAFYSAKSQVWRFSLITSSFSINEKGKAQQDFSNPKRYSYILGPECKKHTPQEMLSGQVQDKNDLLERFSVETVTKEFYKEIFAWYDDWAVEKVRFPEDSGKKAKLPQETKIDENRQHLMRLLTRLIFVWFIKQKNLIPDEIFSIEKLKEILNNFDPYSIKDGNYYNGILQNLFFATLNRPIKDRQFANDKNQQQSEDYGIKTKFRDFNEHSLFSKTFTHEKVIELFKQTPFLNGGLFECLDDFDTKEYVDGFSREKSRAAFVPNALFWGDNKEHKDKGLIDIFKRYNFTVEENTPQDIDVSMDPELLGKVFENLLGTYNEETGETARKESGAFYTPREIVDYMVDISLKEYLKGKLLEHNKKMPIGDIDKSLDKLFSYIDDDPSFNNKEQIDVLIEAINDCKILDPACGSGAFPMGVLHKLTFILRKLDPNNKIWRQKQLKKVDNKKMKTNIEETFKNDDSDYIRKLFLIENCIYGIDIKPIAIQISKLRFFISLILEQKADERKENHGFVTLPNLETKFVSANTLIKYGDNSNEPKLENIELAALREQLLEIRKQHFFAHTPKEKIDLRTQDDKICKKIDDILKTQVNLGEETTKTLTSWNPYKQNNAAAFFDARWMFGILTNANGSNFDIVIGNPPYIQLQSNQGTLANIYKDENFTTFSRMGDIYQLFYERGFNLLKENGVLCFITSNKWMRAGYGELTRDFFANFGNVKMLIDFAGQKVFSNATVDVNIILIEKNNTRKNDTFVCIIREKCADKLTEYIKRCGSFSKFKADSVWTILTPIEQRIKEKIEKVGTPLKNWKDLKINRGILTGCNEAFIINEEKRKELIKKCAKSAEIICPILRGKDIKRNGYNFAGKYLIVTHNGYIDKSKNKIPRIDIENYPAIKKHLDEYWEAISKRDDQGDTPYNLRSCAYMDDFSKQKIIYSEIVSSPQFYLDNGGKFITLNTSYILTGKHLDYLIHWLNSPTIAWIFKNFYASGLGGKGYRYLKQFIENLPIPLPNNNDNIDNIKYNDDDTLIQKRLGLNSQEIKFILSVCHL